MRSTILNKKLAEEIDRNFALSTELKKAFSSIEREMFVSSGFKHLAYKLDALPMGADQWISSPLTVAKMSEYIKPKGADSILEIGCGSGYQAAILSQVVRRVFTIERIESLLDEARERIKRANLSNINTKLDDGQNGWERFAPYDRILFSASIEKIPDKIVSQLSNSGIIVAPIRVSENVQIITRFSKNGSTFKKEELEKCMFVPVLNGVKQK